MQPISPIRAGKHSTVTDRVPKSFSIRHIFKRSDRVVLKGYDFPSDAIWTDRYRFVAHSHESWSIPHCLDRWGGVKAPSISRKNPLRPAMTTNSSSGPLCFPTDSPIGPDDPRTRTTPIFPTHRPSFRLSPGHLIPNPVPRRPASRPREGQRNVSAGWLYPRHQRQRC